jgi:hypothetical protein
VSIRNVTLLVATWLPTSSDCLATAVYVPSASDDAFAAYAPVAPLRAHGLLQAALDGLRPRADA